MTRLRTLAGLASLLVALLACAGNAHARDISGTITTTLTIMDDSNLVGDVTCMVQAAACIVLAASNIDLNLNGFTMTGQGNPPDGCLAGGTATNVERGVVVMGQSNVTVLGPGVIQGFRGWGIFLNMTTKVSVRQVTLRSNCLSGIQLTAANRGELEGLLCIRNGSPVAACGGICLTNSNDNRIHGNLTSGNGYGVMNVVNFGIALEGSASGNAVERNTVVGNVNGIYLQPAAANNVISRNRIEGNPPIGIPASVPGFLGFDIRNQAPAGTNTFATTSARPTLATQVLGPRLARAPLWLRFNRERIARAIVLGAFALSLVRITFALRSVPTRMENSPSSIFLARTRPRRALEALAQLGRSRR